MFKTVFVTAQSENNPNVQKIINEYTKFRAILLKKIARNRFMNEPYKHAK